MTFPINTPIHPGLVLGATDFERTAAGLLPQRLPEWARRQFPDEYLSRVVAQPSGVRLAFRTEATSIELDVLPTKTAYVGGPTMPDGVYELTVDGKVLARTTVPGGKVNLIEMATLSSTEQPGEPGTARFTDLPAGLKDVRIWLPQIETTELIALRTDAPVVESSTDSRRVWLHHGSSISHGSTAASPTTTWPATAARLGGVELINLGFSGNALLDPFTARTMRDTPADLISVKIGINLTNADLIRLRGFTPAVHGFLDTIRDGHPTTPLLVVSPILCPIHEDTPGPGAPDFSGGALKFRATGDPADVTSGKLTLGVIRDELARIVAHRADPNLHYLDGRELFGAADIVELPLPDNLHPAPAGHVRIGERFAQLAFGEGGVFSVSQTSTAGSPR
ncbi:MAG TPA: SGNH/GDSL hydrolase family protein [Pseudonocardiaceae bacterium]|nr:SGNH/GDSL hydrolase family protein [Pseudonocardiaceae bacterium]